MREREWDEEKEKKWDREIDERNNDRRISWMEREGESKRWIDGWRDKGRGGSVFWREAVWSLSVQWGLRVLGSLGVALMICRFAHRYLCSSSVTVTAVVATSGAIAELNADRCGTSKMKQNTEEEKKQHTRALSISKQSQSPWLWSWALLCGNEDKRERERETQTG